MALLIDRATVAQSTTFRARVMMAALLVALEVYDEPQDTSDWPSRINYARRMLNDPMSQQVRLAATVCANTAIVDAEKKTADSSQDSDILTAIRDRWNQLAGV